MSEEYIRSHFDDIKRYANIVEERMEDDWYTIEHALEDNAEMLALARKHNVNYILVEDKYEISIEL